MQISRLIGTCSMVELHDVYRSDKSHTKKEFIKKVQDMINVTPMCALTRVVILNTNWNFFERLVLRFKFGFTQGASYNGNNGKVHTMILQLK